MGGEVNERKLRNEGARRARSAVYARCRKWIDYWQDRAVEDAAHEQEHLSAANAIQRFWDDMERGVRAAQKRKGGLGRK